MATERRAWPAIGYEERPWQRDGGEIASRRELARSRGPYRAAVVPRITDLTPDLPGRSLAAADDASNELTRFDAEFGAVAAPFSAILLRSESASSSEVEHITASARQVALAELGASDSPNARLVVANAQAMRAAVDLSDRLDTHAVIEMHRALLGESQAGITGGWRERQVWIGGGSIAPHTAEFVPPHAEHVPALMGDVMAFARRTDLPVLVQTAIAHAQFETIHPFPDGNGRTGRALVQGMLRAGRVTRHVTVPVSAGLLGDLQGYYDALCAYREGRLEPIVDLMADASFLAVANGRRLIGDLRSARAHWDDAVRARADSSAHRLKDLLLRQPVVQTKLVAAELAVSEVAAQTSIDRLVEAGVLVQAGGGARYRRWAAPDVLAALDAFGQRARRGFR